MSSFKEIGEATANAHEKLEQIQAAQAELRVQLLGDIQRLLEKVNNVEKKLFDDLDAIMNGAPAEPAQKEKEAA